MNQETVASRVALLKNGRAKDAYYFMKDELVSNPDQGILLNGENRAAIAAKINSHQYYIYDIVRMLERIGLITREYIKKTGVTVKFIDGDQLIPVKVVPKSPKKAPKNVGVQKFAELTASALLIDIDKEIKQMQLTYEGMGKSIERKIAFREQLSEMIKKEK